MVDPDNIHATISRVRRQTTNRDILDICDALERRLVAPAAIEAMARPDRAKLPVKKQRAVQKVRAK